jgi:hypothetical protein
LNSAGIALDRRYIALTREDVERFEKVNGQLEGVYEEITSLSKKSPNDGVNKFKLQLINRILDEANAILDHKHKPFNDFSSFDEDTLPSNSDVVFILAQYLSGMENKRTENIAQKNPMWYWIIDGAVSTEKTPPPKKLNRR